MGKLAIRRVSWEEVQAGDPAWRAHLADLVFAAAPEFYGLIPLTHASTLELIASQIGAPGTEIERTDVFSIDNSVVAVVSVLDASRLPLALQIGALSIIRALDPASRATFMAALSTYGSQVEPLEADGLYLSRITVAPQKRGMGIGTQIIMHFVDLDSTGCQLLHVDRQNHVAISLYQKFGFSFASSQNYKFPAMIRNSEIV